VGGTKDSLLRNRLHILMGVKKKEGWNGFGDDPMAVVTLS